MISSLNLSSSIANRVREMTSRITEGVMQQQNISQQQQTTSTTQRTPTADPTRQQVMQQQTDGFEPAPSSSNGQTTNSNPDAVAQQLANESTGWNYDHSGGKTWSQTMANENTFDQSKSGVCADMALEAAQRFEEQGVEARVAFGNTERGNHAWVEYKDANGQWQMFDPTASACTDNPDAAITPQDNGLYGYGSVFERHEVE